jgi:hypothetical protein
MNARPVVVSWNPRNPRDGGPAASALSASDTVRLVRERVCAPALGGCADGDERSERAPQ